MPSDFPIYLLIVQLGFVIALYVIGSHELWNVGSCHTAFISSIPDGYVIGYVENARKSEKKVSSHHSIHTMQYK